MHTAGGFSSGLVQIGVCPPIPKASALVFTLRAAQSSLPCAVRFFTAGFSPLFTRPKAVKKHLSLASEGACLGVGEAEDGSHTLKPALARVTYESMGRKPHVNR